MDDDKPVLGAELGQESNQTECPDGNDRGVIPEISDAEGLDPAADCVRRRKQQLREALVREHIRERERHKARLASLLGLGAKRG